MSFQRIIPYQVQEQLPIQLNNLDPLDKQPNALALQEARNLALLGQALEIIEEKDKVLEQEHAKTHQQDQETILSLQKALQALIQQNSQLTQENIILKSQNDQMNTAHQADMKAAKELINVLQREIVPLKKTAKIYEKGFSNVETAYNQFKKEEEDYWRVFYEGFSFACPQGPDNQIAKTKQELLNLSKEKS